MLSNFFVLTNVYEPVFDGAGAIVGIAGQADPDCLECTEACIDGGFAFIAWSCVFDCDGVQVTEGANAVYEVFVAPQVRRFVPAAGRRRSSTPSNNRVDLNFTIEDNPQWYVWAATTTVPGAFLPYQDGISITLDAPGAIFTTTDPFPGGACDCDDGEFITNATVLGGGPQPVAIAAAV